ETALSHARANVSTPCWVETRRRGRIGAAGGISGRVFFCCLIGLGCPKQAFAKIATPRLGRIFNEMDALTRRTR
ncbi:MAG: hypothetical protein Q8K07_17245, partial [Methylicorpusculum sp.]|uniref:hypothetical protein n=1 Tax=Methylicorpusculum sp. TaxID=2713644 RepID=UPI00272FB9E4